MPQALLLPTFRVDYSGSPEDFILHWKDMYDFPNMALYYNSINQERLERQHLADLFRWKNGMNLSSQKWKSWDRIALRLDVINELRLRFDQRAFEEAFSEVSLIWKIYLLHICRPAEHPIFDQHVYRAYRYIRRQDKELTHPRELELFYYDSYISFFNDLLRRSPHCSYKDVDDALWVFGRFLNAYPKMVL